jgi:multidrug resistance efflux pump
MFKKITFSIVFAGILGSCGGKDTNKKNENVADSAVVAVTVNKIVGIGKIIPENDIIQFAAQTSGVLKTVYKQENESFKQGEVLAILANDVEANEVTESASRINIQQQELKVAQASIAEYESKLANAQNLYFRLKALFEKGAETKQNVENAETEYKTLKANINKLQSQVSLAQARVKSSTSDTNVYRTKLDKTKIIAPCDGKILEWKIQPGEGIMAQQAIAQIAPAGNTIVECEIDESLAMKVTIGQEVQVNYLGSTEVIATGKVYFLSDYLKKKSMFSEESGEAEDRRVRTVKVMLNKPKGLLFNTKVEVSISTK